MDPIVQSTPPDTEDAKAAFRKPSNDVSSRKYRRRSPDVKSSGDHESPRNDRSSSPIFTRGETGKVSEHRESKKDDGGEYDRDQRVKAGDAYGHADSHSSKNSLRHSKHEDYSRREKYVDEDRRTHFERDSRGTSRSDRMREESDNGRSRDYKRYSDKYSRGRDSQRIRDRESYPVSDRKQTSSTSEDKDGDHHRGFRDNRDGERGYGRSSEYRSERTDRDGSRGHVKESLFSRRDDDKYHTREFQKGSPKEFDDRREKKKRDDSETDRDKDTYSRASGEKNEDKSVSLTESQQSEAKRTKFFSSEKDVHPNGDGEKKSSSPKQVPAAGNVAVENISEATNDLNAAKVAAMKAAELVNKNLVGGSLMSTEQKKKLLWGNKKSTTTSEEPSGHRWDTSMFGDRERQEKFNKLMGVKGDGKAESPTSKNNNQEGLQVEKQEQLQMELEKQYTAGLRRRDGRTVGLGL